MTAPTDHRTPPTDRIRPDAPVDVTGPHARRHGTVIVVGAGLAGLTAAATIARSGRAVTLLGGLAPGGRARTDHLDGFALNRGPHALYRGAPGTEVLGRLGIHPDGARPPARAALLWGDPRSPEALLRLGPRSLAVPGRVGPSGLLALVRLVHAATRTEPTAVAPLSIDEWVTTVVPARWRALALAVVRVATYVVDTDRASADVAVTQLRAARHGVEYLHGGWAQLVDGLDAALEGTPGEVSRVDGRALRVHGQPGRLTVDTTTGTLTGDAVVVAAGGPEACARLLGTTAAEAWPGSGPAVRASCLDLGLRRPPVRPVVLGVDQPLYLIAHAPAARLAPPGGSVVHAMVNHRAVEEPDRGRTRAVLEALARQAGIGEDLVVVDRYLHRMTVVGALPTPDGGGLAGRPRIDAAGRPGVWIAGDWVGPDGFLADASLVSGEAAARAALAHLTTSEAGRP